MIFYNENYRHNSVGFNSSKNTSKSLTSVPFLLKLVFKFCRKGFDGALNDDVNRLSDEPKKAVRLMSEDSDFMEFIPPGYGN